jgi:hypothetical protein
VEKGEVIDNLDEIKSSFMEIIRAGLNCNDIIGRVSVIRNGVNLDDLARGQIVYVIPFEELEKVINPSLKISGPK